MAWKGHRGEYGRLPALGGLRARHVDCYSQRVGSVRFHLDREVISTGRAPEKPSTGRGGPLEKAFQVKEKTCIRTLKVLEQMLSFQIFRKSNLASLWRMEEKVKAGRPAGDYCNGSGGN